MNTKKMLFIFAVCACCSVTLIAQNSVNNVQMPELQRQVQRTNIRVPNLDAYETLKCDFHIHTIFSDGVVWPEIRVREAWEEGLDAIAITDHIERNPSKPHVGGDHNSSYEVALSSARNYDILLIKAGEITRSMPPGHLNALFVDDVNKLDTEKPEDAIMEAHRQGGFLIWNHPGWKAQQPDTCKMFDIHRKLISSGVINGIEVFNEKEWYPIVMSWCVENNLAVIATSDIHDVNAHFYPLEKYHRPMTLVFAKDRSMESLKQALFEKRTAAWFGKYVAGKENILNELFRKSVSFRTFPEPDAKKQYSIEIKNDSDFTFELTAVSSELPSFSVLPNSSVIVKAKQNGNFAYLVSNWFINTGKNLPVTITF